MRTYYAMISGKRIAVASIIQESNTFSFLPSTYADFESQGIWFGDEIIEKTKGLNLEISGAIARLNELKLLPLPIMRAWAMSGGTLEEVSFLRLREELLAGLKLAGSLDGVILNLHGALVSDQEFQCDARFTEDVRQLVGPDVPIIVTHDLHANVGKRIVAAATAVIGYKTYPHIDQGDTGARAAELLAIALDKPNQMNTALEKVNILIPAEIQPIKDFPMNKVRELADSLIDGEILDISLFPVQPWLDVPELGFGFLITHLNSPVRAEEVGKALVKELWIRKNDFILKLISMEDAIKRIQSSNETKPFILVQSADAPPGGATGDDASVLFALLGADPSFASVMTLVDEDGVRKCASVGVGADIEVTIGSSLDPRWSDPVLVRGKVTQVNSEPIILTGPVMNGQKVSIGMWATIDTGTGVHVLVTERPAPTFDPSVYIQAGFDLKTLKAIQVRSCALFRSGFAGLFSETLILDLAGATTPNFDSLIFNNIPRPMFPLNKNDKDIAELDGIYL